MMSTLDCGDNSCMFALEKKGMRTNGGCRCLENATGKRSQLEGLRILLPEVLKLRAELAEAREVIEFYACQEFPCDGLTATKVESKYSGEPLARAFLAKYPKGEK